MRRHKCARCGRVFETATEAKIHVVDDHPAVIQDAVNDAIAEVE